MTTVLEGRAAYNISRTRLGISLEMCNMNSHEAMVAQFFKQCAQERPVTTERARRRYPVLSEDDLRYRREQELYGFGPGESEDGSEDFSGEDRANGMGPTSKNLAGVASLVADRNANEAWELAQLRGEPYGGV